MKFGENKKFYYGTSTYYNFESSISPYQKLTDKERALYKRKKTAKIRITTDPDAALYYAEKSSSDVGGDPIVYEVVPDRFTLIKISKNEYYTSSSNVVKTLTEREILYDYFMSKIPNQNNYDSDYIGSIFTRFISYINSDTSRDSAIQRIINEEFNTNEST